MSFEGCGESIKDFLPLGFGGSFLEAFVFWDLGWPQTTSYTEGYKPKLNKVKTEGYKRQPGRKPQSGRRSTVNASGLTFSSRPQKMQLNVRKNFWVLLESEIYSYRFSHFLLGHLIRHLELHHRASMMGGSASWSRGSDPAINLCQETMTRHLFIYLMFRVVHLSNQCPWIN